jgi:hypothetical protein
MLHALTLADNPPGPPPVILPEPRQLSPSDIQESLSALTLSITQPPSSQHSPAIRTRPSLRPSKSTWVRKAENHLDALDEAIRHIHNQILASDTIASHRLAALLTDATKQLGIIGTEVNQISNQDDAVTTKKKALQGFIQETSNKITMLWTSVPLDLSPQPLEYDAGQFSCLSNH